VGYKNENTLTDTEANLYENCTSQNHKKTVVYIRSQELKYKTKLNCLEESQCVLLKMYASKKNNKESDWTLDQNLQVSEKRITNCAVFHFD
jgi:hypothetical protein